VPRKTEFHEGENYIVTVLIPPKRKPRESCMQYLGASTDGVLQFSGRPEFGTTEIKPEWIVRARKAGPRTKHYANRMVDA
jgi:hypothetical protein